MKTLKPSMDSMLRFLDTQAQRIATFIAGQNAQWLGKRVIAETACVTERYRNVAKAVREISAVCSEVDVRKRAAMVAGALEDTQVPPIPFTELKAKYSGRWHSDVSVKVDGRRLGEQREVSLGPIDYLLTVQPTNIRLETSGFDEAIGLEQKLTFQHLRDEEDSAHSLLKDFKEWVLTVNVADCRSANGKEWKSESGGGGTALYFACLPKISSLSTSIKRLRKFEEALPAYRVFVCLADAEEANKLNEQGFGTIVYPTGEFIGRPCASSGSLDRDFWTGGPSWLELRVEDGKLTHNRY